MTLVTLSPHITLFCHENCLENKLQDLISHLRKWSQRPFPPTLPYFVTKIVFSITTSKDSLVKKRVNPWLYKIFTLHHVRNVRSFTKQKSINTRRKSIQTKGESNQTESMPCLQSITIFAMDEYLPL
jgi:hypothetical protein